MNFSTFLVALCGISIVGVAACVGGGEEAGSADDEIKRAGARVSGFDLEGPKALPPPPQGMVCAAVVSKEKQACGPAGGKIKRAAGCNDLCSVPLAEEGMAAGYDFKGFQKRPNDKRTEVCAAVISAENLACDEVGGATARTNGCGELCSKPIAPRGKTAGYDLTGFQILPSDKAPLERCTQSISPVHTACTAVAGELSRVNGCKELCSLPL